MSWNLRKESEWRSEQWAYFQALTTVDLIMLEAQIEARIKLAQLEGWKDTIVQNDQDRLDILRRVIKERTG